MAAADFALAAATRPPGEAWAPAFAPNATLAELALAAGASAFADAAWTARCRAVGIKRIAVCGGGTEHGVAATARAALAAGYETWLLVDACCHDRRDAAARATLELRAEGMFLATHDRFLALNASHRVPAGLLIVEPLRRWLSKDGGPSAAWAELLRRLS